MSIFTKWWRHCSATEYLWKFPTYIELWPNKYRWFLQYKDYITRLHQQEVIRLSKKPWSTCIELTFDVSRPTSNTIQTAFLRFLRLNATINCYGKMREITFLIGINTRITVKAKLSRFLFSLKPDNHDAWIIKVSQLLFANSINKSEKL